MKRNVILRVSPSGCLARGSAHRAGAPAEIFQLSLSQSIQHARAKRALDGFGGRSLVKWHLDAQEHAEWLASRGVSIAVCSPGDVMLFWGGCLVAPYTCCRSQEHVG